MEGERVARSREAGIGVTVLTVHHASVPPMSVEKWKEVVQEKVEKLQPQPTSPEQTFPCHSPGGKVTSAAQSWGRACSLLPLQLCVVGLPPDMVRGWDVAPSASNPGWHIAIANYVGLAEYRI